MILIHFWSFWTLQLVICHDKDFCFGFLWYYFFWMCTEYISNHRLHHISSIIEKHFIHARFRGGSSLIHADMDFCCDTCFIWLPLVWVCELGNWLSVNYKYWFQWWQHFIAMPHWFPPAILWPITGQCSDCQGAVPAVAAVAAVAAANNNKALIHWTSLQPWKHHEPWLA